MKHLFTLLCWAVPALGVFLACSKKPQPPPIYPPHHFEEAGEEMLAGKAPMDPDEKILDLEAPTWAILFDFDSYRLREPYKAAAVAEYLLKTHQGVYLSGHASEEGVTEYNLALGAQRAVAVRNFLEASGVPVDRITWESFGEEKPVTQDPELKHLNRRVEIIIERKTP